MTPLIMESAMSIWNVLSGTLSRLSRKPIVNHKITKNGLGIALFLITGCDQLKLGNIETASDSYCSCLSSQVMPGECNRTEQSFKNAILKAQQAGISNDRISASIKLGKENHDIENSPYNRIKNSLENHPYHLPENIKIFSAYKNKCSISDIERISEMYIKEFNSKKTEWFMVIGIYQNDTSLTYYVSKTTKPCLPKAFNVIDKDFPIITTAEISLLERQEIIHHPYYVKEIKIEIYDSVPKAEAARITANSK